MPGKRQSIYAVLKFEEYELTPDDFLHFVELDEFVDDWDSLGLNIEVDLVDLQILIMSNPQVGSVVTGTGGLRKVRFTVKGLEKGKSGAYRVLYAHFPEDFLVLLVKAYGKGQQDNIDESDHKGIAKYLKSIKQYLDEQRG